MSELLNLIGLSSAIALYAMLLMMVLRAGRTPAASARPDPLLLATAILGLVWNLCALPAYELPKLGIDAPLRLLTSIGLSALGFLPAVVVHSVLRGEQREARRGLAAGFLAVAYGVSTVAALLHLRLIWTSDPLPSAFAMRLLTFTFVALLIPLAAVTGRQPGARRALWVSALAIFAVSALHLSQTDRVDSPWIVELLGHHASLPLAVAILYQDFPFAFADLFLKRALTLLALVAAPFAAVASLGMRSSAGLQPLGDARDIAVLVTLWVATAILYPRLRDGVGWFVDTIVLNRPDYSALRTDITRAAQAHEDISLLFDDVCARLAPALSARIVRWQETLEATNSAAESSQPGGAADPTSIDVPVAEPPRYALEISGLTGGRRLLSDDRAFLDATAAILGRRIDAIRITRERYQRELKEQEMGKLATEAELRALRSQMNPHFLFNALTTIGYLIQTAPPRALDTLFRLTSLLRAVLRSDNELTTLGRELELVESYLEIEHARFEHRLRVRIDVPSALRGIRIPALLLQPLVENAVKHGIGPERYGGDLLVMARLEFDDSPAPTLTLVVKDSGAGATAADLRTGRAAGVGLNNIERRLACQYGAAAHLIVDSAPGLGTMVEIRMPAEFSAPVDSTEQRSA
jgi:signal transduction histidine kinase